MHRTNVFRYAAIYAIENKYYKNFNLLCVVLSTICLALEDPLDNDILNPEYPERYVRDRGRLPPGEGLSACTKCYPLSRASTVLSATLARPPAGDCCRPCGKCV